KYHRCKKLIAEPAARQRLAPDLRKGKNSIVQHRGARRETVCVAGKQKSVVVIGNGMVGHRFCERLIEFDSARACRILTFCEEPRPAYDRVNLTKYFDHRKAEKLALATPDWYAQNGITLHIGDRATEIDRTNRVVRSARGQEIAYDV